MDGYTDMFRFYSKNPSKASIDNVDVVVVVENCGGYSGGEAARSEGSERTLHANTG